MHDFNYVLEQVRAGEKIRIYSDIYGARLAEFRVGWLLRRKVKVELEPGEVDRLKDALRRRRLGRTQGGESLDDASPPATQARARTKAR
jgi:hypothetical protein